MRTKKYTSDVLPTGVCELTIGYRRAAMERMKITSAEEAVAFAREHFYTQEEIEYSEKFYVMFIDRANKIYAWKRMSEGGLSGTMADPRLIYQAALLVHASNIILMHNHPSGNTQPSASDLQLTKNLIAAGKVLEITVLDHCIVTTESFYSFANEGLI
jgi:DNA repair protein RadC